MASEKTQTPPRQAQAHAQVHGTGGQGSLKMGLLGLLGIPMAALFTWYNKDLVRSTRISPDNYVARADAVLASTPLIDGHNDLPFLLRLELHNQIYDNATFSFRDGLQSHTDLARLREGRVGGQFWSVFVECDAALEGAPNAATHAVRDTLEQIDVARRLIDATPELELCTTPACARRAHRHGRIASMLGAEGLHQTGGSIAVLRALHGLGVRYVTVTHNCDNPFATAASTVAAGRPDGGLTALGRAAVAEMNRLGMLVDLSHASHATMRDVLAATRAPVVFSHTACHALAAVGQRNAPDDVIARLRDNGGVLMVMFVRRFVGGDAADVETVVDHIMHVVEVAGWDHVGIGGDFDGAVDMARGLGSVADYPELVRAVMRRGATDAQVRKLVGLNILRVWKQNEEVAARIAAEMRPVEDVWEGRTWSSKWNDVVPRMIPGNPFRDY